MDIIIGFWLFFIEAMSLFFGAEYVGLKDLEFVDDIGSVYSYNPIRSSNSHGGYLWEEFV